MAFPSTVGTKPDTLNDAWQGARGVAGLIKTQAQTLKTQSLAGNLSSSTILDFATVIADAKVRLNIYAAVPGLAAYAQAQVNDNTLDVASSFTSMVTQLDALRDWIITNFPKDGSLFLLAKQFDANGRTTDRQFSTATLATFRTQLDALIATIN